MHQTEKACKKGEEGLRHGGVGQPSPTPCAECGEDPLEICWPEAQLAAGQTVKAHHMLQDMH